MMADSDLRRTHPATVAVRTVRTLWQVALALVGVVVFGSLGSGRALPSLIVAAVIALIVLIVTALQWLSWWRFRYGILGTDLIIEHGLLIRTRRTIPIARVHGVNVRADLFMRALGVVELVVQTAGGGGGDEPEAKIGTIPLDRAEELRNALLHDVSDTHVEVPAGLDPVGRISDFRGAFGGAEVRGRELRFEHKVPLGLLIVGELTSNRVPVFFAVAVGAFGQLYEIIGQPIVDGAASRAAQLAAPILVVLVIAAGALLVLAAAGIGIARDFGFTARRYEMRIETEAGLFERRQTSIPIGRIQAVRIEQSWLRRLLGLAAIQVDTAGLERSGDQSGQMVVSKAMVPAAKAADVAALMHGLLPEAEEFPEAHRVPARALRFYVLVPTLLSVSAALVTLGAASWFFYRPALPWAIGVAVLTALFAVGVRTLQWRRAGVGTDEVAVTLRSGAVGIKRVRLTRSRIQSLDVRQNPFQRRAGLASLRTVSVSGSSQASYGVAHLDEAEALRIMRWYQDGLARPRSAVTPR